MTAEEQKEEQLIAKAIADPVSSMRELVKENLYYFIQYFWPEYSQDAFVDNWHIRYICEELQKVAKRVAQGKPNEYDLVINIPPGTTKTAMISIMFPIWCWVNWFWMRFITASYTASLSLESAEYSREIVRAQSFKELFPELEIKEDKDTKSNYRIIKNKFYKGHVPSKKNGGNRYSTSVGGTLMGFHGHINIVDDPIDPTRAVSDTEIRSANHWMDNVLPFRKADKKVTATILVMQRLHQNDPTGHWLKIRGDEIKHICLPGEIRNYENKVKPVELKENYRFALLDVNRLDWDTLNKFLKYGQYTYGSQIGQDPVPLGGGMFKTDHIGYVDYVPGEDRIDRMVRYWDKAGTEGGDGAYTVGVKMAKLKNGTYVVIDVKRGRWSSEERERILKETAEGDGARVKIYVEQEPGSGGKESAEATVINLAGYSVYKDRPTGNKVFRADPYSVQVNEGNVKLVKGSWNELYVDELKNFPNSTFKDQTDASSGAFSKLTGLRQAKVYRKKR